MKAVVTGAGGAIGRAAALTLVEEARERGEDASLCLVDHVADSLAPAEDELKSAGAKVISLALDLSRETSAVEIARVVGAEFGALDALISNAGIFSTKSLLDESPAEFDRVFAVNTRATWLLARACHPALKLARGAIVATASVSGSHQTANAGAYSASKAALIMLVRQLAFELGSDGIRCNSVSPGTTHTAMTEAVYSRPGEREKRGGLIPLGRIGAPIDIARVIAFLAGPRSAYVTGVNIPVDGGLEISLMPHFWQLANLPAELTLGGKISR